MYNRGLGKVSGYTLLELVLVLAILGVVLAAAAPSLGGFGAGRKADEAAARFVALTRLARSRAISDGCLYRIVIDTKTSSWWLQVQEIDTFTDVEGPLSSVFSAAEGVTLETSAPMDQALHVIEFDALGRAQTADVFFIGKRKEVAVTCDLPTTDYHVVTDDEVPS